MNERERQQLTLITKHEIGKVQRALEEGISAVFTSFSLAGRVHSGAHIIVSVRAMGELADAFLADLLLKVKAVAIDPEAFAMLSTTVGEFLDICLGKQIPAVTRKASGLLQGSRDEDAQRLAIEQFDQVRSDIASKLAIAAFDFEAGAVPQTSMTSVSSTAPLAKKGGRPPAEFWDNMWAAIATALYEGTLKPKTQADVERAMAEWIEAHGYSAADSTVRGRARRLWDSLSATDE